MPAESELLTKIVDDYCASNADLHAQREPLAEFCRYAAQWLVDHNCLGLGYKPVGLSLRFADGSELGLFSAHEATNDQPAVSISGTKEKLVTKTMADTNPSVQITGRY